MFAMSNKEDALRKGSLNSNELKPYSDLARKQGLGNGSDFASFREITISVGPSVLLADYSEHLWRSMQLTMSIENGVEAHMPFSAKDLEIYFSILIRERVKQVSSDQGLLFKPGDFSIVKPGYIQAMLTCIGEVVDEKRHLWLHCSFDEEQLTRLKGVDGEVAVEWELSGRKKGELSFVTRMSRLLSLFEKLGFRMAGGLPKSRFGERDFMLFMWDEERLKLLHPYPDMDPGLGLLAAVINLVRATQVLNPYITYGTRAAYSILLQDLVQPASAGS
jgi:hypothetical protein